MSRYFILIALLIFSQLNVAQDNKNPLKIGIVGLSHSHVHWILGQRGTGDYEIVGIVESDTSLANRYLRQYNIDKHILFPNISEMLENQKPEAVTAFGSIYEHLSVVEHCAPLGIHVMVEKPLAVSLEHADKMKYLAEANNILLLTNYETTWYSTNHKAYEIYHKDKLIGDLKKIIVRDGHKGPKEIGVNEEFLEWLTDPKLNGGGAIIDFGCYGANLITWITNGKKPVSVTALTQQLKPDVYPKVDDEATILLEYRNMQGIIQASWNWPFSRKDMEVYGRTGYVIAENRNDLKYRNYKMDNEEKIKLGMRKRPYNNPFTFLFALVRKQIELPPYDLSSLENNMIVMEILDAAIKSAKTGKSVILSED